MTTQTYQELLKTLEDHGFWTDDLQKAVTAYVERDRWVIEGATSLDQRVQYFKEVQLDGAALFITQLEVDSWKDTDDSGWQNAGDTVKESGLDPESLAGIYIFASSNTPSGDIS
jgi:hypothetical protein